MRSVSLPDISNLDDFLQAKSCPICSAIGKDKASEISYKHDTRLCLNKYLILHYLSNNTGSTDDKELRKYTMKCLREINKYRKSVGKIEI